jgi:hypothetical protein
MVVRAIARHATGKQHDTDLLRKLSENLLCEYDRYTGTRRLFERSVNRISLGGWRARPRRRRRGRFFASAALPQGVITRHGEYFGPDSLLT